MLVVDAANVVGSRPTGWWRDRAGAAADLHLRLEAALAAGALRRPVVMVLEGAARGGVPAGGGEELLVVHAAHSGDDEIVSVATRAVGDGLHVSVVTADRGLRERVERLGADVLGPRWLLERLDASSS
jgi:hypothetical protein